MYYSAATIDDLMYKVLTDLTVLPFEVSTTRSGDLGSTSEQIGVLLKLENPRARLSRSEGRGKVFSALGELLWYLAKSDKLDFISYYISKYQSESEDGSTIYGAYGPRLFRMHDEYDQIEVVCSLLKRNRNTRRAVIQLIDSKDVQGKYKEIPCTCTMQFFIRENKLHMHTSMRSNDAYMGIPHDIFVFTMLQEIIACTVGVDLGSYTHSVGSLHLYENHKNGALQYLAEGLQTTNSTMPAMPLTTPWKDINYLLEIEEHIRMDKEYSIDPSRTDPYWTDLIRLLSIFSLSKHGKKKEMQELRNELYFDGYRIYADDRIHK